MQLDRPTAVPHRRQQDSGGRPLIVFMVLWFTFGLSLFAAEVLQSSMLYWVTGGIGLTLLCMALSYTR